MKKVYVGTANWGKPYGVAQTKVSDKEIDKILDVAHDHDCGIETAWDYGCMDKLFCLSEHFDIIFKGDEDSQFDLACMIIGDIIPMKHHAPYDGCENRSIYDPKDGGLGLMEFPLNLVDQRFLPYLSDASENLARSVFIQGLAFGMPDFHGIPFYHLCWNFVRNNHHIDGIVVGVDSAKQLEDILSIPNYEIDYGRIGGEGWIKTL